MGVESGNPLLIEEVPPDEGVDVTVIVYGTIAAIVDKVPASVVEDFDASSSL